MAKPKTVVKEGIEEQPQTNLPTIIETAIAKGATIEVVEKLLALQERYDANQARKAFDKAMSDIRQDLPKIVKDRRVDFGAGRAAYKYEDLFGVTEALSPVMAQHGLSFRWRTLSQDNGAVKVTVIISHVSGHSEESSLEARPDMSGNKNPIQAIGSAVTYLQRYTLKAAIGVAAAPDDDAQSAGPQREQIPPPGPPPQPDEDFSWEKAKAMSEPPAGTTDVKGNLGVFKPDEPRKPLQATKKPDKELSDTVKAFKTAVDEYLANHNLGKMTKAEAERYIIKHCTMIEAQFDKETKKQTVKAHPGVDTYEAMSDKLAQYALKQLKIAEEGGQA